MSITKEQREKTKRLSIAEGSASSLMLGFGEQYVVPFALRLGASSTQLGILSSIPYFIGSLFQILGARITDKYMNRKKIVSLFVLGQAISFIPLFIIPLLTNNFWILTLCFTAYLLLGNIVVPAWSSWMGDVIPLSERGKYFGLRNKITILFLFGSVLLSGIILNYLENNIWLGFGILFFFAFLGRLISFILFLRHSEPKYQTEIWNDYTFKQFMSEINKNAFGRFVIFRSMLAFSVMVAGPFFAVLMLEVFEFSYVQFSIILLTPMIIKALTMTYWGSLSNIFGNKNILRVSAILIGFVPFFWLLASVLFGNNKVFVALIFVEMVSGFTWAGMELTTFNYMLEASHAKRRVKLFAYYNVIFNSLVMMGGLVGSGLMFLLSKQYSLFHAIIIILAISVLTRLTVALLLTPRVRDLGNHEKVSDKRLFYDILVHRPLGYASSTAVSRMAFIENTVQETIKKFNGKNGKQVKKSFLKRASTK